MSVLYKQNRDSTEEHQGKESYRNSISLINSLTLKEYTSYFPPSCFRIIYKFANIMSSHAEQRVALFEYTAKCKGTETTGSKINSGFEAEIDLIRGSSFL